VVGRMNEEEKFVEEDTVGHEPLNLNPCKENHNRKSRN